MGAADLQVQLPPERQGHDAVLRDPRGPGAADLRLTGEHGSANPPLPISKPDGFSAEIASKIGLYRTLGWAESADKPLNEGRLDEAAFLYDSNRAMDDREKIIFENLDSQRDWDLFVAAIETTDRMQHMMWRLIDPTAPDVRRGSGGEVRRRHREGLPQRRRPRGALAGAAPQGRGLHGHVGPRLPFLPPRGEPQHLAGPERLHGFEGQESTKKTLEPTSSGGGSSSRASTGAGRRPTPSASGRSISTCAAGRARGSSRRGPSTRRSRRRCGRSSWRP